MNLDELLCRLDYALDELNETLEAYKFANAIKWKKGMTGTKGIYYLYKGKVYRCINNTLFPIKSPENNKDFTEVLP